MRATAYRFVSETRVALQLIPAGVYVATAYRPSRIAIGGRRGTPAEARRETTVEVERRDSDAFRAANDRPRARGARAGKGTTIFCPTRALLTAVLSELSLSVLPCSDSR